MERSALFARREAAKVLNLVLQGDSRRRSVGSIKSLVYSPSVRNKNGTFALVCETLKHLMIIKQVTSSTGDVERFLLLRKEALQAALDRLLVKKKVKSVEELIALDQTPGLCVQKNNLIPDLLILPPGSDLHDHPLIVNGSVFMQGKASSMVAEALAAKPGWEVLDACSAPGNKTVHLAALMGGEGKVIACELNEERVKRLKETIRLSGASNIKVLHGDFLQLNPEDPAYSKVHAILLSFLLWIWDSFCKIRSLQKFMQHMNNTRLRLHDVAKSVKWGNGAEMTEEEALAEQQRMFADARARMNGGAVVPKQPDPDQSLESLLAFSSHNFIVILVIAC